MLYMVRVLLNYLPPYIHPGRNHNSVPCGELVHILEDSVSGDQTLAAL